MLEPMPGGGVTSFRSPPLKHPGVYHLSTGNATLPVAVNVPADEADIRTLDNAAIKRALGDVDVELEGDSLPPPAASAQTAGTDFGWPLQSIEPAAFAYLAWLRLRGRAGNLPETTGARRAVLCGVITENFPIPQPFR